MLFELFFDQTPAALSSALSNMHMATTQRRVRRQLLKLTHKETVAVDF